MVTGPPRGQNPAGAPLGLLRGVLSVVSDGVIAVEASGRFTLFNTAAEKLLGLGPQEVEPSEWPSVYGFRLPEGGAYPFERLPLARAMRGEIVKDEPIHVSRPGSGTSVDLTMSAWPLPGPMGRRGGAVAVFRDAAGVGPIDDLEEQVGRLRVQASTFKALHEVAVAACGELGLDALGSLVVDNARILVAGDDAALALARPPGGELTLASHTAGGAVAGSRLSAGGGVAAAVMASGRPLSLEDYPAGSPGHHHRGYKSLVAVPLAVNDLKLGALAVFSKRRRRFTEDEINLLNLLAAQVAPALEAARLHGLLADSERHYRLLHSTISCGVLLLDREGVILESNQAAARVCRVPQAALRGPFTLRFMDPRDEEGRSIAYEDRPFQIALRTGASVPDRTINVRCPDGRRRWLLTRSAAVAAPDGEPQAVLSFVDVTELKRAEGKLLESRAQLQQVISTAPVVLFTLDLDGVFTFAQGEGLADAGIPAHEMAGRGFRDVFAGNPELIEHLGRSLEGHSGTCVINQAGRDFEVVYGPLRNHEDEIVGATGVAVDVTDRSRSEQAERENRAKSHFLAGMSHELRTPLNAVLGFAQLLQNADVGPLNERQARYVRHIVSSGHHLLDLVNDVLDISKVVAGQMQLDLGQVHLDLVTEQVCAEMQPMIDAQQLTLEVSVPAGLTCWADPRRLAQILRNLISNAVKFTEPGGRISLSARPQGHDLELAVGDTGIGIAEEYMDAIFEEFAQVPGTNRQGSGLGLSLSRSLVTIMNGSIAVDSEVGRGSTFIVRLPLAGD